jgi:hypothetical protein
MKLFAIVEFPADTQLTTQCPDLVTLGNRISAEIQNAALVNTFAPEIPTVRMQWGPPAEFCSRCAAPLLPSGACSSRNCPVGRQPHRKLTAGQLARSIPGVKLGSALKKK